MLTNKSFFADLNPILGTDTNVLFYDPTTTAIRYSPNTIGASSTSYSSVSSRSTSSATNTTWVTYLTTSSLRAGMYFIVVCWKLNRAANSVQNVRILNNSDSSTIGNYGTIDIQLTSINYPGVISGDSRLTGTSTFSFQFNTSAGTSTSVLGADMACFYIGP